MEEDEDIKILEEYLDKQDRKFVSKHRLMILQAVENLIARYKELEEENRKLTARKYMLNAETGELKEIPIDNNYIPKSKVKDKIEEIQKECFLYKNETNCEECFERCSVEGLQELLEEFKETGNHIPRID